MNESNPPAEKAEEGAAGTSKRPKVDSNNNKSTKRGQDESSNVVEDTNENEAAVMIDLSQDTESPGTLPLHSNDGEAVQGDHVDQRQCFVDNICEALLSMPNSH